MAGQVLTSLIYSYIESHIQKVCKDSFDSSYVEHLERVNYLYYYFLFVTTESLFLVVGQCRYIMAKKNLLYKHTYNVV